MRVRPSSCRARGFAIAALAVGAVLACRRAENPPPPASSSPRATLVAVAGDVRMKRSVEVEYGPATKGSLLSIADQISTGASGHATLLFDDGSTATITPHSLVLIEPPATGAMDGLEIRSGRVEIEFAGRPAPTATTQFRVRTPDAEAAMPAREIGVVHGGADRRARAASEERRASEPEGRPSDGGKNR